MHNISYKATFERICDGEGLTGYEDGVLTILGRVNYKMQIDIEDPTKEVYARKEIVNDASRMIRESKARKGVYPKKIVLEQEIEFGIVESR